jgi:hypothetical protein
MSAAKSAMGLSGLIGRTGFRASRLHMKLAQSRAGQPIPNFRISLTGCSPHEGKLAVAEEMIAALHLTE